MADDSLLSTLSSHRLPLTTSDTAHNPDTSTARQRTEGVQHVAERGTEPNRIGPKIPTCRGRFRAKMFRPNQNLWQLIFLIVLVGAEGRKREMRGGKIYDRDSWFGLRGEKRFEEFRPWWHRTGKKENHGKDLQDREEAYAAYKEWEKSNPPKGRR